MPKKSHMEAIMDSFENENIVLNEDQLAYKERLLAVIDLKVKNLYIQDYKLYKKLKKEYPNITFPSVCNYISIAERIIANEKNPSGDAQKVWIRYLISQITLKAIELAENKGDGYTMSYAANTLGNHFLTDKEDNIKPRYDEIVPFVPEITSDVRVLGIKPIKDLELLRAKLEKKYGIDKAMDVEFESIENESNTD